MQDWREFLVRVEGDFPNLRFRAGRKFSFRPARTIVVPEALALDFETLAQKGTEETEEGPEQNCLEELEKDDEKENNFLKMQLLHEVGHAVLGHREWATDLMRVKMECAAWVKAREFCEKYGVRYDEERAEGELDSYRDWLHQRSRCGRCGLTRYQTQDGKYHCPECETMF